MSGLFEAILKYKSMLIQDTSGKENPYTPVYGADCLPSMTLTDSFE